MFWLEEAGLPITGANVARAMQLSPPTVREIVARLTDDGYVERNPDKSLTFTESGRDHASHIVRRHRMIERFLTDVLGIPWDEVHEEAERIEHAMSPVLEERMRAATRPPAPARSRSAGGLASRAPCSPTSRPEPRSTYCASRTRPRSCCITSRTRGCTPGWRARSRRPTRTGGRSSPRTARTWGPTASPRRSRAGAS